MFRGIFAGAAAYKWGGGCVGTVLVFILIYTLLGHCLESSSSNRPAFCA
ncbi:MAG: hypothetical protein WAT41_11070 [Flavobacteriales bacterium]